MQTSIVNDCKNVCPVSIGTNFFIDNDCEIWNIIKQVRGMTAFTSLLFKSSETLDIVKACVYYCLYYTKGNPFKNYGKCFLFHLEYPFGSCHI